MPGHGSAGAPAWARDRFVSARVARLATVTPDGGPHVVPVVFALTDDDIIWIAIDSKPKTTRALRRLDNIAAHPRVSLLVDHYADDWAELWWVRVDGTATIHHDVSTPDAEENLSVLAAKYPQYQGDPPAGPLIRIDIDTWRSWSADEGR